MSDHLTLREIQVKVDEWISENGGYFSPLSIMAQVSEESGELARILNNLYGDRVKKLQDPEKEIGKEICDLIFALICLANSNNIDLDKEWKETISARCERDKERYK
jgi:NTP pyrophosphatase (non-canonical NTP hydrolase)